jgi:hypothetical protein
MVLSWSEKERAVIELLKQRKRIREIAQQLHISSRDVCYIRRKYEEEPNYVIEHGEDKNALQTLDLFEQGSHVTGPHKDQKCDPNSEAIYKDTEKQLNIHEERDNLIEENQALKDKNEELTKITLELGEENQALKHKKIELDYKLKHKYIESRSGILLYRQNLFTMMHMVC